MKTKVTTTLTQGTNGYWFIRKNGVLVASAKEYDLAVRIKELIENQNIEILR